MLVVYERAARSSSATSLGRAGPSARVADPASLYGELCRTATTRHQRNGTISGSASVEQIAVVLVVCCAARRCRARRCCSASGRRTAASSVIVVLASLAVHVGVEVGGVVRVPLKLGLRRLLRTEALAVVLVGLCEGRGGRVGQLFPGHSEGEATGEHEGDDE